MGCEASKFYILTNPKIGDSEAITDFLKADGTNRGDAPRCPECHQFVGMKEWLPPYRVELEFRGVHHGDIAFFMEELLVSKHLADCVREFEMSGIEILSPAVVVKVKPEHMASDIPEYFVARVSRSVAQFDPVASHAEYREMWDCRYCLSGELLRHRSVELVRDTWNGEDLFVARGLPGVIITSARFKEFCDRHKFRNVKLVEAAKFGVDWFPAL